MFNISQTKDNCAQTKIHKESECFNYIEILSNILVQTTLIVN